MAIDREKVLQAAQKYVEKKKYDKAVAEYRKITDEDPSDARTRLKIGDLLAKQTAYAEAISEYETVGKLYAQQGFALKAIAVYKQIRELIAKHVPQLEERYGHITPKLAELYQQLGLTSDALAALDEVATRLQRQQRDPEAVDVFRRIVELDPTNPLPHLRLAEALSRVRDIDGAVEEFKTAANQLATIGRRDDALKVIERLLHHKPDPEQAKVAAELYLARGQASDGMQALAKLQLCFQANPRDFDTLSLLARAFNAIGQGTKAIEVQKEMARVARDTGKADLFREIVERLLRVAPQDDGVRKLAGQLAAMGASGYVAASSAPPPPDHPVSLPAPSRTLGHPPTQATPYRPEPAPAPRAMNQQATLGTPYRPESPASAMPAQRPVAQPPTGGAFRPAPPPPPPPSRVAPPLPPASRAAAPPTLMSQAIASLDEADDISYQEVEAEEVIEEVDEEVDAAGLEYSEDGEVYEVDGDAAEVFPDASTDEAYRHEAGAPPDVLVPSSVRAAEEYGAEHAGDITEQLQKVLADASAFRRVRLYNKALDTLRIGLELEPRAMDLHEAFRDILIESGQTEDAIEEMLHIASLYVDALDGEAAARALQDVLAFDPQNARAISMLQELGYEIVDESQEGASAETAEAYAVDAQGALPSYDLEEMGPADVSPQYVDDRQVYVRDHAHAHAHGAELPDSSSPSESLPSFPLDSEAQAGVASSEAEGARAPFAGGGELEDALEEAEFFCTRGLLDDARAILEEQLARHPNHPLLRERVAELDALEAQRGSGARERPREQDRSFDIAASLDALESLDYGPTSGPVSGGGQQVDVEEVFSKFKEGVAKQISVDDSDSHYNLGIAYKEMMLLDDAIREFEVAARDPKRECVCRSMIGMIRLEQGNMTEAIDAFLQGLNAPLKDPQQETVLCFEIGAAYEAKKLLKDALSYYQKAMRRDPNYRDVQERVRRLAKSTEGKTPLKAAVGADDDFDRAFEDLLGKP